MTISIWVHSYLPTTKVHTRWGEILTPTSLAKWQQADQGAGASLSIIQHQPTMNRCNNCNTILPTPSQATKWGSKARHTTKDMYTSQDQSPWHESNNYSPEHIWKYNEEHVSKQSNTAKKMENDTIGDKRPIRAVARHNAKNGETWWTLPKRESLTSSEIDILENTSDTTSDFDRLECDPPLSSTGLWRMSGGTGILVLEKVGDCGKSILNITRRNSTSGGTDTKMNPLLQSRNGAQKTNAQHHF